MVAIHEALIEDEPARIRFSEGFLDLSRTTAVRLLAEHMLACAQRPKAPWVLQPSRQGHIDGINTIVTEEIVVVAVRAFDPPSCPERFSATYVTARDGDNVDIRGQGCPRQHLFVDVRRREHSPAQRFTHAG